MIKHSKKQQFTAQSTQHVSAFENPYLFTGRRFEDKIGLYYYRNRYYEPKSGRFVGRDPTGYIDDMTLYSYVMNNSMNWIDPYGLIGEDEKGWVETVFDWLRKLWGTSFSSGRGLLTPQTPTPLTGIGNTLLTPEGAEAQRGGIEFVRCAQRDKMLAGEPVYGTYSPLTESGSVSPQTPSSRKPASQKPTAPQAPATQRPTQGSADLLSPRTRELMEVTDQFYKVQDAFEAAGKYLDDLRCIPGYRGEYEAAGHRAWAQYIMLRRIKSEILKRINELKKGF